jgi:Ca2+-binding EF-hand superfamily protein
MCTLADKLRRMADQAAVAALFKFFDDDDSQGLTLDELKAGMITVGSTITETEVTAFFNKV